MCQMLHSETDTVEGISTLLLYIIYIMPGMLQYDIIYEMK